MILSVDGITFGYGSEETISGIGFTAGPGDLVAILGPNGAGKTTLLRCMNRINGDFEGSVTIDSSDLTEMRQGDIAKLVGYVPQRMHVSGSTVFESVLIGRKPHMGFDVADRDIRLTARAIDLLGLSGISGKRVNEISGGEYQLVQIARAVVQQTRVMLLDEPTSNLDLGNQHMVMKAVSGLVKANGICAVMTCHDINLALRYADRFVIMRGGRIHCAGGRDVVTSDVLRDVYGIEVEIGEIAGYPVMVPKG